MPTKDVLALLTDAPPAHLHELYIDGAAAIVEAYLTSGFPFLAIDPDRQCGFRLPDAFDTDHFPELVDVVFITLADLGGLTSAKGRPELRTVRAQGSAYFEGRPEERRARVALKSCATRYVFGIPQAITPPAAREIMDWVYPQQAQHLPDRIIADRYREAVAEAWAELRQHAEMAEGLYDPLFEYIVSVWREDLPVIVSPDGLSHCMVPRGTMWTQFQPDA